MAKKVFRYGLEWPFADDVSDADAALQIEMACVKRGGAWKINGQLFGLGLIHHYEQMRRILWPHLDDHRWHQLCLKEIRRPNAKVTVLMGAGSTGKTHESAWNYLCEYMVFPEDTCVLVSSTTIAKLQQLIWGEITMLWQKARDRFDWLPGHLLEHRIAITTDTLEDGDWEERRVRDMRKGIVGIPCVVGNKVVGLSKYQGIKQRRMRLIADEASAMSGSFLSAFSNLNNNEDFQAIILGNPNDVTDSLGKAAEPLDGWSAHMEPSKTEVWDTMFMRGRCINLVGPDSPNFDYPLDQPSRYPYLIDRKKIEEIARSFGKGSYEYYSQCLGIMKISTLSTRVLTRELCVKNGALEECTWEGTPRTKVAFLDSAWGGDRCVFTWGEFGRVVGGKIVLRLNPPEVIPIANKEGNDVDYMIAEWCRDRCDDLGIPPENFGHDSTGRGSLGTALARVWSAQCNPVEFGGQPTKRIVTTDFPFIDPITRQQRPKLCSEHYIKFVSELWYSVRYCVEAGQLKNLAPEVMDEFCMRNWKRSKDDKIEVEPKSGTKERPGMKQRTGRSPDLADSAAGVLEMARRRGFTISKLANEEGEQQRWDWLLALQRKQRQQRQRTEMIDA